jgi:hypothetical protein
MPLVILFDPARDDGVAASITRVQALATAAMRLQIGMNEWFISVSVLA